MTLGGTLIAVITAAMIGNPPSGPDEPLQVQRFGLYILASDPEALVAFYAALFGRQPKVRTRALVAFDLSGGLFGIVPRRYAPARAPRRKRAALYPRR